MEFDDEITDKIERLARETNTREINIHVRQPARKKQATVTGFPFSLIEQALHDQLRRNHMGRIRGGGEHPI